MFRLFFLPHMLLLRVFDHKKLFILIFLVICLSSLISCGVPDFTSANLNNLNRPQIKVFNNSSAIVLNITGFYPPDEYPNFIGYNIYVGENNDSSKVVKRIMYNQSRNNLPTLNASPNKQNYTISFSTSELLFRFTKDATDTDLITAGAIRGQLYQRGFRNYEKYYFIVEAVEVSRTGLRSEPQEIIFLNYQTNTTLNYNGNLDNVGFFDGLSVDRDSFIYPTTSGYSFSAYTVGKSADVFGLIPKNDSYSEVFFKPYYEHIYYFKAEDDQNAFVDEYLVLQINETNSTGLVVSYGHEKEVSTDLNTGLTPVN